MFNDFKNFIESCVVDVHEGMLCPLDVITQLKTISDAIDKAKEDIMFYVLSAIDKNDGKGYSNGLYITKTQSGRYNYSKVPQIVALSENIKRLEKLAQAAYKLQQDIADPVTGELIPAAEYTPSAVSIKITKN